MTKERIQELRQLIQDYTKEIEKARQAYFDQANPIITKRTEAESELADIERGATLTEYLFDNKPVTSTWLINIGCVFDEEDRAYRYARKLRILRRVDTGWGITVDGIPDGYVKVDSRHDFVKIVTTLIDFLKLGDQHEQR